FRLETDRVTAPGRGDGDLRVHADEQDGSAFFPPISDLVAELLAAALDAYPALTRRRLDRIDERRPLRGRLGAGGTVGIVPLRRQIQQNGLPWADAVDLDGLHRAHRLVEAGRILDAGVAPAEELLVGLPIEVGILVEFAPELAAEHVGRLQVGAMLDAEQIVKPAPAGAALPVLVPQARHEV